MREDRFSGLPAPAPECLNAAMPDSLVPGAREFHTTRWSVVLAAQGQGEGGGESSPGSREIRLRDPPRFPPSPSAG